MHLSLLLVCATSVLVSKDGSLKVDLAGNFSLCLVLCTI